MGDKVSKFNSIIEYSIVLFMLILSGSIIPFVFFEGYSQLLLIFSLLLGVYFFIKLFKIRLKTESILFFLFVMIFLILHAVTKSSNEYLSTYVGLILRFIIAFFITTIIKIDSFLKKFIDLMIIIVAISLIFYFIGILYPEFIMRLPVSYNDVGTSYGCAYIYFYQGAAYWNYRNCGIFWEGGAFSVFINIALLFRLFYFKQCHGKKYLIGTGILILGVLTTISTVGIFILAVLIFLTIQEKKFIFRYVFYFFSLIFIIASGMVEKLLINKFSNMGSSGSERLAGIFADIDIFLHYFITGAGFDYIDLNFDKLAVSYGAVIPSSTNSFTRSLALYGIIFTTIVSVLLFKLFVKIHNGIKYQILLTSSFILLLCTQVVIFQLLFICFMFYGTNITQDNKTKVFV